MKKLLFLLLLCFCFSYVTAETETCPNYTPSYKHVQDDWVVVVAVSEDGKRIKAAYQIDMFGNVRQICGFKVWDGYSWSMAFGGSSEYGYYVIYFGKRYYFN